MKNVVERLSALLKERKNADSSSSYVASLYAKGNKKIIEKINIDDTYHLKMHDIQIIFA